MRFFFFFTILTNILVAIYFSANLFNRNDKLSLLFNKRGTLTAITVYITMVGLVYQVVLRKTSHPQGLQRPVDELLHSVIPILVIIFWILYEKKSLLKYGQIPGWLIYPFVYLIAILIVGSFTVYHPYPFVDVSVLGMFKVLMNSFVLLLVFSGASAFFISIEKLLHKST